MDRPDIIVGVDLGTTYTGVAWARPQRNSVLQSPIQIVHNWPGTSTKNEQKVQTCLIYNNHDGSLSSWGPLCEDEDDLTGKTRREFFKIFLDRETLEAAHQSGIAQAPASVAEAQRLVTDYLRQVYVHVKSVVELHTGIGHVGWKDLAVEFAFSVPTTWQTQEIVNVFKSAIRDAGFGTEGKRHVATVELTESEAAAVGTVKSSSIHFAAGDIFLCVDAGGGTTDFALMRVIEAREPFPALSQINQVDGIGIGAALIDQAFVILVNERLNRFPDLVSQLPPDCTERLVKSERYRTMKHKFGEKVYQSPSYKLPLEGAPYTLNHPAAGIELGKIVLTWEEVQSLFEPHIASIMRKIEEQLNWLQSNGIDRPIRYMILSGGLGSSRYVRDRIQHLLATAKHPYANHVQILQAPDPQLVVVKGLLLDRLQSLDSGLAPVIVSRIARASYGYLCKRKFDPAIHSGEEAKKDPYDGELYAHDQIDWLIKKGDSVQTNKSISSAFTKKIDPGDSKRTWDSTIIVCDLHADSLPSSTRGNGWRKLCTVTSNLTGVQDSEMVMKRQAKKFLLRGKKFYICTFEVRAIVAPADLRFELWFGGQKFSKNHEPIQIAWDANGVKR